MTTKMPFLFFIPSEKSPTPDCTKAERDTWVVKIASFDYKYYHSSWMCDDLLGDYCLIPDVDQAFETHLFYNESEALIFVQKWCASQVS
jgi:hypothetical protein